MASDLASKLLSIFKMLQKLALICEEIETRSYFMFLDLDRQENEIKSLGLITRDSLHNVIKVATFNASY